MCGMNGQGDQWRNSIFTLRYTSLKMAVLLLKTALVNFPMATTVYLVLFRLEFMVARVKNDMDKVERQLSEAEASVESTTAGGTALKSINKIIFVSFV